jgi:hypothetical protein
MEHIKIEQNSNVEVVDSNIIHKLAEEAQDCDASSNMTGNLQTNKAFRSDVNFLTGKFPGLSINAQNYYIDFADDEVARIMNSNYGDGTGVTEAEAAAITSSDQNPFLLFGENTEIETFDELKYLTSIDTLYYSGPYYSPNGAFENCTNLKSIDLTNVKKIGGEIFANCSNLETLKNFHPTEIFLDSREGYQFYKCIKLKSIDLSLCTRIPRHSFDGDVSLETVGSLSNTTFVDICAFANCDKLTLEIDLPLYGNKEIEMGAFYNTKITAIEDLGQCVSIHGSAYSAGVGWRCGAFAHCTSLRYANLPATLTEIQICAFHGDTALEYIKCLATTPPTLGETDPANEDFPFYNTTCKFYVPDASVNDYKSASGWSSMSSRIFSINQFATDFPDDYAAE